LLVDDRQRPNIRLNFRGEFGEIRGAEDEEDVQARFATPAVNALRGSGTLTTSMIITRGEMS